MNYCSYVNINIFLSICQEEKEKNFLYFNGTNTKNMIK